METRLIIAYGLMALLAIFAVGTILLLRRNSFEGRIARQRARDDKYRAKRRAREGH